MPDPRIFPIVSAENDYVTVTAVSTVVRPANHHRADLELVNDGDNVIYLSRGDEAVIGEGMRINPNGGSYRIGTNNMYYGAINGISEGLTNMSFSEGSLS